nr:hypothetical protein [Tanacetum cinerariifolium]
MMIFKFTITFPKTADPTKVRVAERQRAEDEPMLMETTVRRVVPLLPVALARASSELEASVDKLFNEGVGGDGKGVDIQPVIMTTNTIVEDVAPLQPRRQRKRKTVVVDASGPSHPSKKLKEDCRALGGAFAAGKSRSVVQSLFTDAVLNAEARGEPILTLPFVTSSVSATPEREEKSPADFITGLNLRTIGAPQRSFAPAIATVTTVTAVVDAATTADKVPVEPSLFGVGSSSTGRTDSVPGGFSDVYGSDFLIGGIRTFNVGAARQISLSAEVRIRAEYNIREKRRLRSVVDEQAELLKVRDGEIENLKAQLLLKEAEAAKAIRLRAEVFKFEATEKSIQGEVGVLRDHSATLEKEKNDLTVKVTNFSASVKVRENEVADLDAQVHELEISSVGLQEKVVVYEDFIGQLEKFQDEKIEERLQNVNFSLIAELKSNKDASVDTIMNLLRLDDTLAERKIRENISSHVSAFRGVFVPLSAAALEGTEGTSGSAHDTTTTLSVTIVFACTISPISTDDYEVAHADGQEGASVDGKTVADENNNPFSDVSNAELNILE